MDDGMAGAAAPSDTEARLESCRGAIRELLEQDVCIQHGYSPGSPCCRGCGGRPEEDGGAGTCPWEIAMKAYSESGCGPDSWFCETKGYKEEKGEDHKMNALKFDPEKPGEMTTEEISDVVAGGDAARMVMFGYQNGSTLHRNIMLEAANRLRRLGTGNSNRLRLALSMAIDYMKDAGCAASAVSALEGVLRMPSRNCDEFDGVIEATMAFKNQKGRMPDMETMSWCFANAKKEEGGEWSK